MVPLVFDLESTSSGRRAQRSIDHHVGITTILCVGRITPHKCQHDVIHAYARFRRIAAQPSQLIVIGRCVDGAYWQQLQQLVRSYGLSAHVQLLGQVSAADLRAWYRVAAVLVSLSEHEGFCVPLLEAMRWDVPVVAYACANIPATLAGAGVLLCTKAFDDIANVLKRVVENAAVRRSIIVQQRRRVRDFWPSTLRAELRAALATLGIDVG
ncbi:MAG: glycosyltransferase [Dehalococcoidia bacterium]